MMKEQIFSAMKTPGLVSMVLALYSLAGCDNAQPVAGRGEARPEAPPRSSATIDEAIAKGEIEVIKSLLAANPGAARAGTRPDMPPLHQAILRKRSEIALLLVEAGTDVNAVDSSERTPLHLCVERDLPDLVAPLAKAGADPDARDKNGWTPLHHAGAKDRVAVAVALIENGANLNIPSNLGGTPLHEAAASGSAAIVKLFLDGGVDPSVVAKDGTALDVAVKFKNEAAVELLEKSAEN